MKHNRDTLALISALTVADWPRVSKPPAPEETRIPGRSGTPVDLASGTWYLLNAGRLHETLIDADGSLKVDTVSGYPGELTPTIDALAQALDDDPAHIPPAVVLAAAGVLIGNCHRLTPKQLASVLTVTDDELLSLLSAIAQAASWGRTR